MILEVRHAESADYFLSGLLIANELKNFLSSI